MSYAKPHDTAVIHTATAHILLDKPFSRTLNTIVFGYSTYECFAICACTLIAEDLLPSHEKHCLSEPSILEIGYFINTLQFFAVFLIDTVFPLHPIPFFLSLFQSLLLIL